MEKENPGNKFLLSFRIKIDCNNLGMSLIQLPHLMNPAGRQQEALKMKSTVAELRVELPLKMKSTASEHKAELTLKIVNTSRELMVELLKMTGNTGKEHMAEKILRHKGYWIELPVNSKVNLMRLYLTKTMKAHW